MKWLSLIFSALFFLSFNVHSDEWQFQDFSTSCHLYSNGRLEVTDNEVIHYFLAFAYVGKEYKVTEHFKSIGLRANDYVLQINLNVPGPDGPLGTLGDRIDVPVQLKVNGKLLDVYEKKSGSVFYIRGESARKILSDLGKKDVIAQVLFADSEYLLPFSAASKDIELKKQLLNTCVKFFS